MPAAGNMMTLHEAPLVAQNSGSNAAVMQFLFLGLIVVAFYFFLIRPQRNRQRQQQQLQNSVRPGQRVMTTNGMFANVVAVDDDGLVLELAPGVEARFVKQAIMQIVDDSADEDVDDDDEADEDVTDEAAEADEKSGEKSSSKPSA
jgi:preprotein translocase subunit YajC